MCRENITRNRLTKQFTASSNEILTERQCNDSADYCIAQPSSKVMHLCRSRLCDDKDDAHENAAAADHDDSLQPKSSSTPSKKQNKSAWENKLNSPYRV